MRFKVGFDVSSKGLTNGLDSFRETVKGVLMFAVEESDGVYFGYGETVDTYGVTEDEELLARIVVHTDDSISPHGAKNRIRNNVDSESFERIEIVE